LVKVVQLRPGDFVKLDLLRNVTSTAGCLLTNFLPFVVPVVHKFINAFDLLVVNELVFKFGQIGGKLVVDQNVLFVVNDAVL
jgi:hypothetical protein